MFILLNLTLGTIRPLFKRVSYLWMPNKIQLVLPVGLVDVVLKPLSVLPVGLVDVVLKPLSVLPVSEVSVHEL